MHLSVCVMGLCFKVFKEKNVIDFYPQTCITFIAEKKLESLYHDILFIIIPQLISLKE